MIRNWFVLSNIDDFEYKVMDKNAKAVSRYKKTKLYKRHKLKKCWSNWVTDLLEEDFFNLVLSSSADIYV